ncbi:ABC transporter [Roseibium aquae]|uniref:ABC transporter n=1 Tax=Roseibium aquae TaxID=1323746 RepID=A0A916TB35_9HYPH|nr:ABC-type transport auxiliary lipoprotein family protein [Roseibium aquae]GGB37116.1 ABC transporter [Roseibium aquae]
MTRHSGDTGRRHFLALVGGSLLLSACSSSGPVALYGLSAAADPGAPGRRSSAQVLVTRPRALKALDTEYIAVAEPGPIYSYFPNVAWADSLPSVVQSKIVETLQNTNRLRGVGMPGDGLLIDYQLQTELRAFELRVGGSSRALVEIAAKLVNDRNGRTVASRVFRVESSAGTTDPDRAVAALNRSADQVFSQIAEWTLQSI